MITSLEPGTQDEIEEVLKDVIDPDDGGMPVAGRPSAQTAQALDGIVDAHAINWVWGARMGNRAHHG